VAGIHVLFDVCDCEAGETRRKQYLRELRRYLRLRQLFNQTQIPLSSYDLLEMRAYYKGCYGGWKLHAF